MRNYFNKLCWKIIRQTIFFNLYTKLVPCKSPWRKRDLSLGLHLDIKPKVLTVFVKKV